MRWSRREIDERSQRGLHNARTWGAGEDFGDLEWLGEEALDLARAGDGHLVLLAQLIHAQDGNDVLQVLVVLRAFYAASDTQCAEPGPYFSHLHRYGPRMSAFFASVVVPYARSCVNPQMVAAILKADKGALAHKTSTADCKGSTLLACNRNTQALLASTGIIEGQLSLSMKVKDC